MMCSAYKLNKQGDSIQPWCTSFPIWNESVVPCLVLTFAYLSAYRFFRRQSRWSGIPISGRIFHSFLWGKKKKNCLTVKVFSIVNEEEVDVFLEFCCFFNDPTNVGNLISGSSAFSKPNLYIWKLVHHVFLMPCSKVVSDLTLSQAASQWMTTIYWSKHYCLIRNGDTETQGGKVVCFVSQNQS